MMPNTALPLVSIVIPVYNGANFLADAIDSALAQTYPNTEIIVINDGSDDDGKTQRCAFPYGKRIRYFEKPNGGVASALNFAIGKMRGDYFAWLSHDDEFLPHKLSVQIDALRAQSAPEDSILFSGFEIHNLVTDSITEVPSPDPLINSSGSIYRWLLALFGSRLHGCTALIPRAVFDRYGVFDESLKTTQDYEFFCRVLGAGVPFIMIEDCLIRTRYHAEQGTLVQMDLHLRELREYFTRSIDLFHDELASYSFVFVEKFLRILKDRRQPEAYVYLHNRWCAAQCSTDAEPLWLYWECGAGTSVPDYIYLCWKTIAIHCSNDLRITIVTPETLAQYLPDIDPCYKSLVRIAHRADFIRFNLLYKFGGVWLDSDMVVFRSLGQVMTDIRDVGFAAMGYQINDERRFFPIISFLAAHKGNEIAGAMVAAMRDKITWLRHVEGHQPEWDEIGGDLLRDAIKAAKCGHVFYQTMEYFAYMPYWVQNIPLLEESDLNELYDKMHPRLFCQALTNSRDFETLAALKEEDILAGATLLANLFQVSFSGARQYRTGADLSNAAASRGLSTIALDEERRTLAHGLQQTPGRSLVTLAKAKDLASRYARAAISPAAWHGLASRHLGTLSRSARLAMAGEYARAAMSPRAWVRLGGRVRGKLRIRDRLSRAMKLLPSPPSTLAAQAAVETDVREVFGKAYRENIWNSHESVSGEGSTLSATQVIRSHLPLVLKLREARVLLDAPCGDFNWMQHTDLGGVSYIGGDIVGAIVRANQERFGNDSRRFTELDIIRDALPDADVMLCRDCLIHLSFLDIDAFLKNLHRSQIKYLLTNTYPDRTENIDIATGQFRPVNLRIAPFDFPEPLSLVQEGCGEDSSENEKLYADKSIALWRVADIPIGCPA